jgi:chromosome segregation ATPase
VPPSADAQITSVSERLSGVEAHELTARDKLAMLRAQTDAVVRYAADLRARQGPRRRPYALANVASLSSREVERGLSEIASVRRQAESEQRALATLRDRVGAVQARATLLQHRVEAQRIDVRAQADQVFDVRMSVARLQDQTSRLRRPDPRIAGLARSVSELEGAGSADTAILSHLETELDATLARATGLLAGITADERSLEDESQKLARAETALLARRAELRR